MLSHILKQTPTLCLYHGINYPSAIEPFDMFCTIFYELKKESLQQQMNKRANKNLSLDCFKRSSI